MRRDTIAVTERTTLHRGKNRGSYDRATIYAVLDEAFICNLSCVIDGRPVAIPMAFSRVGDSLILHGSTANRVMRALRDGAEACVTITLVDGLGLARSAFHHSVNYRSVVVYARAREIADPDEKLAALRSTVEHIVPGRWNDVRHPNDEEFLRTMILALPLTEASAKSRSGAPIDDPDDYALAIWAGEIPLRQVSLEPLSDPAMDSPTPVPSYASHYRRPVG
ncbi:MAG: pyridoxamine 5'-phosphate oxidase family protein [Candidatus Binatia bacterium]